MAQKILFSVVQGVSRSEAYGIGRSIKGMKIKHKFDNHKINSETKILIIGTFNPDIPKNGATFFYGRPHNFLWSLLPRVFGEESLKSKNNENKLIFMKKNKIDFIDLISEIEVEKGQEDNYSDEYIDNKVLKWNNIIDILKINPKIQDVYFTRETFSNIKNIKLKIEEIKKYCENNKIRFIYLTTPARYENERKFQKWEKDFGK